MKPEVEALFGLERLALEQIDREPIPAGLDGLQVATNVPISHEMASGLSILAPGTQSAWYVVQSFWRRPSLTADWELVPPRQLFASPTETSNWEHVPLGEIEIHKE